MKRISSILLVLPGADPRYQEVKAGYSKTPPPLGLVILAELVRHAFPHIQTTIIDGNYTPLQEIKAAITSSEIDILGLTDWYTNHETCLDIARFTKSCQPRSSVIIGGPNAGHLHRQILRSRDYVDGIVAEDGEYAFLAISSGTDACCIPNFHFRDGREIISTPIKRVNLDANPLFRFDYTGIRDSMMAYDSNRNGYSAEFLAPFPLSSIRGCIKAAIFERCTFCSIPGQRVRVTAPAHFWGQVQLLHEQYGIESFFETGDEFCVGDYPKRLLALKPKDLNPSFRIYIQPSNLTEENLTILSKLGVTSAFVGIEHISPTILSLAKKTYDSSCIKASLRSMVEHGIRPLLGFLLGLPGETAESAQENIEFALELVKEFGENIQRLLLTIAIPAIGSEWFENLASDRAVRCEYLELVGRDLRNDDCIDYDVLTRISVAMRCKVDWNWLNRVVLEAQGQSAGFLGSAKITTFGMPRLIAPLMGTLSPNDSGDLD